MIKLYRIRVNNWGWDAPRTYYTSTKADAEELANQYPASDPVQYAGRYTDKNAVKILAQYGEDEN